MRLAKCYYASIVTLNQFMPNEYTTYQLKGLLQLADFRNKFYDIHTSQPKIGKKGQEVPNLNKSIHSFIRVFCENHFADSDYTILQKELRSNYTTDWLGRLSIDVILKLITYIIWTDKSMNGYFVKRIEDNTMLKLLTRLENVVYSYNMKKQDTPSSDFGSTPFAVSA